jgi:creatinine amidohydrolase
MNDVNSPLLMDELTTFQISELLREKWTTVIVPLGATEQHGPALPLLVDNEHGLQTALRAARTVGKTLVGPAITLGHSPEHAHFAGTVSLSKTTLAAVIHDVAESHARSGFQLIYFWIAHGGNHMILQEMLPQLACKWPGCRVSGLRDLGDYISKTWNHVPLEKGVDLAQAGSHAGEFETSMMLAMRPSLVQMERAAEGNLASFDAISGPMMRQGLHTISPNGVLGDQRGADTARGNCYLDSLAAYLAAEIRRERGW